MRPSRPRHLRGSIRARRALGGSPPAAASAVCGGLECAPLCPMLLELSAANLYAGLAPAGLRELSRLASPFYRLRANYLQPGFCENARPLHHRVAVPLFLFISQFRPWDQVRTQFLRGVAVPVEAPSAL